VLRVHRAHKEHKELQESLQIQEPRDRLVLLDMRCGLELRVFLEQQELKV
jgi:hypothetical protein